MTFKLLKEIILITKVDFTGVKFIKSLSILNQILILLRGENNKRNNNDHIFIYTHTHIIVYNYYIHVQIAAMIL